MPASYPAAVYIPRTKQNKAGVVYDAAKATVGYAEDIIKIDDEVVAVETLVGKNDDAQTVPVAGAFLKGKADGKSKWSTEIFVSTTGNVGIGTTAPSKKLEINVGANQDGINVIGSYIPQVVVGLNTANSFQTYWYNGAGYLSTYQNSFPLYLSGSVLIFRTAGTSRIYIKNTGEVGIGTDSPTAKFDINSDVLRLRTAKTPANASAAGNAGDICWDTNYIYVCVATNTWKRSAIVSW
jgi:hypothetical protein